MLPSPPPSSTRTWFPLAVALTDLLGEIERTGDNFGVDEGTEHQVVEQVLGLMQDVNGEVKNLAVKASVKPHHHPTLLSCFTDPNPSPGRSLAGLVRHVTEARITTIIERLVEYTDNVKDEGVRDIASLGLKTVVAEIRPTSSLAAAVCSKLVPKLIHQLESVRPPCRSAPHGHPSRRSCGRADPSLTLLLVLVFACFDYRLLGPHERHPDAVRGHGMRDRRAAEGGLGRGHAAPEQR